MKYLKMINGEQVTTTFKSVFSKYKDVLNMKYGNDENEKLTLISGENMDKAIRTFYGEISLGVPDDTEKGYSLLEIDEDGNPKSKGTILERLLEFASKNQW